jgi:hypothetical protein
LALISESASAPKSSKKRRKSACVMALHVRRDIHTDWHWENMSARPK